MKGIGIVLLIVGGFLMFNSYQSSQTFAAKLNSAIGNDQGNRGIAIDGIAGFVLAIIGGGMATMSGGRKG